MQVPVCVTYRVKKFSLQPFSKGWQGGTGGQSPPEKQNARRNFYYEFSEQP